jgi:hypothetical protein
MNGYAFLFFAIIIAVLVAYIVLQRRDPDQADAIAGKADSWWKRLLAWAKGMQER